MMHSFAELRANLGFLASRNITLSTLQDLKTELWKMGSLRKKIWFKPPSQPVVDNIPDQTEFVGVTVKEQTPEIAYCRPRTYSSAAPASISHNAERYLPYRILWAKVIIRATYDYALWKESPDSRLRKFAQDAEKWLFESSDLELSFENICFAFDFPVEKIRQKTRTLTRHDVKKLEFRERQGRSEVVGDISGGNHK